MPCHASSCCVCVAGSYVMATELAAALYNRVLAQQAHHKHHPDICTGPYCFRWTFLVVAALCCVATAFAVTLWIRSRQAYKQVIKVRVDAPLISLSMCSHDKMQHLPGDYVQAVLLRRV